LGGDVLTIVERSIEIKAPPEKVWEMLALDRLPEWEEGYKEDLKNIEYSSEVKTPEDKYRVGLSAHLDIKGEGEMDLEITESIENEKITYHFGGGKFTKDLILTFLSEPVEEETRFTYTLDYEIPRGILVKFLEKLFIKRRIEKGVEKSLENLKNIVEK
jgi:uncharacterized membrane protein